MLLGIIINWLKAHTVGINFTELGLVFGLVISSCKVAEKLFGISNPGSWLFNKIKYVVLAPVSILKKLEHLTSEVVKVKEEVTYNGGTYLLSTAVQDLMSQSKMNYDMINDIIASLEVSDQLDTQMKFKTDQMGYCLWANPSILNYFGWLDSDVEGFNWKNNIDKRDLMDVQLKWAAARLDKSNFNSIHRLTDRHGGVHLCHVRAIAIVIKGVFKGHYGTITEILKQ